MAGHEAHRPLHCISHWQVFSDPSTSRVVDVDRAEAGGTASRDSDHFWARLSASARGDQAGADCGDHGSHRLHQPPVVLGASDRLKRLAVHERRDAGHRVVAPLEKQHRGDRHPRKPMCERRRADHDVFAREGAASGVLVVGRPTGTSGVGRLSRRRSGPPQSASLTPIGRLVKALVKWRPLKAARGLPCRCVTDEKLAAATLKPCRNGTDDRVKAVERRR